jgi:hypothetical protein
MLRDGVANLPTFATKQLIRWKGTDSRLLK